MAEAIASNNNRNLFFEVNKIKGRGNILPACVDGASSYNDICGLFCKKYDDLYNSVPYVDEEMVKIKDKIQQQLCSNSFNQYVITVSDVIKCIGYLKHVKTNVTQGLYSDHLINGCDSLYVHLTMICNAMLSHGISLESLLLGTMVPIPKNNRQYLCNSDDYRAIALSSIIGKILDWIIIIKEEQSLSSSSLQFGFKDGTSTNQSTFILNETVSYYTFNHTNVYAVFLDVCKAFDHMQYCKLFNELVNRNISPLVLRLLLNMYTKQKLQVRWGNACHSSLQYVMR